MLNDLRIRNFAIIEDLEVSFAAGFNVLTGETGAGKSIIIDAVNLLLGERARTDQVRTGCEEAVVEGVFEVTGLSSLQQALEREGLPVADELLLRRVVSRSGKSRAYVNGTLATLNQLQAVTDGLVHIYGQHEHQQLQRSEGHLQMLDHFAGLQPQVEDYARVFAELFGLEQQLARLETAERERAQRLDLLRFQCQEISVAHLQPGEDEELERERRLLQNAERLARTTAAGFEDLYEREGSVAEVLGRLGGELEALSTVDDELSEPAEAVRNAQYALEEVARELQAYAGKVAFEPSRQEEVERRLNLIAEFKRKYASTIPEILAYLQEAEQELSLLEDVEGSRLELEQRLSVARKQLDEMGGRLSEARRLAAEKLRQSMTEELAGLAMQKAHFEIRLLPLSKPSATGFEEGEFYLSTNPGEEPRPLARIASGGELSRIMLALKNAAPSAGDVPVLIFDEVDAGIGGGAASAVGGKLKSVAEGRQSLCITHLPQVAAFADWHYHVVKQERDGRTLTQLSRLDPEQRVQEMARMLGGAQITEKTLEHAREMVSHPELVCQS